MRYHDLMASSSTLTLYLVRHAHAGESRPDDPDDPLRPLSRKGQGQADTLAQACTFLGIRFHRLFSSPYTRAAETAAPLTRHLRGGRVELLSELSGDDYGGLLAALHATLKTSDTTVGLVGHEPYLSGLTSLLLSGAAGRVKTRFRKGMIVRLDGPLEAGRQELHSALTPTLLKRLLER